MSFTQNLIRARSHIVFLAALVAGFFLVQWLDTQESAEGKGSQSQMQAFDQITPLPLMQPKPSSEADMQAAHTAWIYFQNNTNHETGLANSANAFPSTTMWETGSYLIAILSADRLG